MIQHLQEQSAKFKLQWEKTQKPGSPKTNKQKKPQEDKEM
jgi:hypothetical protein